MTDYDRRLVELYDDDNPDGPDHDFYRALAKELRARSIIDLGCGTGILTVTLAHAGRSVIGIDPSSAMLDHARSRDGGGAVTWIHGDSRALPSGSVDLAVMTGNVAQHIAERDWRRTLNDLHDALGQGGTLAFESRNPAAQAWREWTSTERTTRHTADGPLEEWTVAEEVSPGVVQLIAYNHFTSTDETLAETQMLHFRTRIELERELDAAGFAVMAVYGDWQRGPVADSSAILIFVATAR